MNGKHDSQCGCLDCLAYLERETLLNLDEWMPSLEAKQQLPCTAPCSEALRPRSTNGNHDSQCSCLDCIAFLERERLLNLDDWMPSHEAAQQMASTTTCLDDVRPPAFTEGQALIHSLTVRSSDSNDTIMSESYVGKRIHKKFGRKMISGAITAWDEEYNFYHVKYDDDDSEDLDLSEMQSCLIPSDNYVGRRIDKRFNRKWYSGTITAWDAEDKVYHVKYDDSDSEDLDHGEMHGCLVSHEGAITSLKRHLLVRSIPKIIL